MEDLFAILFWAPVLGVIQAVVAILWPSDNPAIRRLQRITAGLAAVGLIGIVAGILLGLLIHSGWGLLAGLVVGYIGLMSAGHVGAATERRCRDRAEGSEKASKKQAW